MLECVIRSYCRKPRRCGLEVGRDQLVVELQLDWCSLHPILNTPRQLRLVAAWRQTGNPGSNLGIRVTFTLPRQASPVGGNHLDGNKCFTYWKQYDRSDG